MSEPHNQQDYSNKSWEEFREARNAAAMVKAADSATTWDSANQILANNTYHVPKRFGIAGILAITTLMAILFGIIQRTSINSTDYFDNSHTGHPLVYTSLSVLVISICLVQMRYGSVPRLASMAIGAVIFPAAVLWYSYCELSWNTTLVIAIASPLIALPGMFCGYLAGTLTAGCFMLVEQMEQSTRSKASKKTPVLFSTDIIEAELADSQPISSHKQN